MPMRENEFRIPEFNQWPLNHEPPSFQLSVRAWRKGEAVQAKALAGLRRKALPNRKLPFSWFMTRKHCSSISFNIQLSNHSLKKKNPEKVGITFAIQPSLPGQTGRDNNFVNDYFYHHSPWYTAIPTSFFILVIIGIVIVCYGEICDFCHSFTPICDRIWENPPVRDFFCEKIKFAILYFISTTLELTFVQVWAPSRALFWRYSACCMIAR